MRRALELIAVLFSNGEIGIAWNRINSIEETSRSLFGRNSEVYEKISILKLKLAIELGLVEELAIWAAEVMQDLDTQNVDLREGFASFREVYLSAYGATDNGYDRRVKKGN